MQMAAQACCQSVGIIGSVTCVILNAALRGYVEQFVGKRTTPA
jgi:hypothetical protein